MRRIILSGALVNRRICCGYDRREMKVKDIISRALNLLGQNDLAAEVEGGATVFTGENKETVQTLLCCFNAVEDELARFYFTLKTTETFFSYSKKFDYANFVYRPVKILTVTQAKTGRAVDYTLTTQSILCDETEIAVTYEYAPIKRGLDGDSAFYRAEFGENLITTGICAEYCLIIGCMKEAETWESKYRQEIDATQRKLAPTPYIPPRRWV